MKGVERTKGVWWGSGKSGRKGRKRLERKIRRAAKRGMAKGQKEWS